MATETAPGGEYQPPSGGGSTTTVADSGYPLRFDVEYPDGLSRWLIFVKWLLAIPHWIILYVLFMVAYIIEIIAFFAILFTKKFPRDLFNFTVGVYRWNANVAAYTSLMRDEYPPFSWDEGVYPVKFEVDYPEELNRWLPLIKWLLAFPHYLALIVLGFAALVVGFIAFFAILFTAQYPRGMFEFIAGVLRWNYRVYAYVGLMRDEYPPFSLNP